MGPAANLHIHGFLTGAYSTAHSARHRSRNLTLPRISLPVLRLPLLRTGPTPSFCETLEELSISTFLFKPLFLGLPTTALEVSGPEPSLSWGFDTSASFDGFGFFAAMIGVNCVPVDGASVDNWVYIRWRAVGRHL